MADEVDLLDVMTDAEMETIFETLRDCLAARTLAEVRGELTPAAIRKVNIARFFVMKLIDKMRLPNKHPRLIELASSSLAPAELVNLGLYRLISNAREVLGRYASEPEKGTLCQIATYFLAREYYREYTH